MEEKDLKNKRSDVLQSELKMIKITIGVLIIVVSLLIGVCIYGLLTKDNNATFISLLVVAFSTGTMIPLNYITVIKIKKELKLRLENQ